MNIDTDVIRDAGRRMSGAASSLRTATPVIDVPLGVLTGPVMELTEALRGARAARVADLEAIAEGLAIAALLWEETEGALR